MKPYIPLILIIPYVWILTACSPPEPSQENFLSGQTQALDKAKNVEKIGFEHKNMIDKVEKQAQ